MALVSCPECNKEISNLAAACPHCGYPIEKSPTIPSPNKVTTVELTGKKWKRQQLTAALMIIFGVIFVMIAGSSGTRWLIIFSSLLIFFGFILFISSKISAWWHHG